MHFLERAIGLREAKKRNKYIFSLFEGNIFWINKEQEM